MFVLTDEKKALLERMHGEAKERRHADRMKAVLLTAEGCTRLRLPKRYV